MFYLDMVIYKGITSDTYKLYAKDSSGNPVDLTGWQVFSGADNEIDLLPTITTPATGETTISLTDTQTSFFPDGLFKWDLCFQNPSGERLGPYIGGNLTVNQPATALP